MSFSLAMGIILGTWFVVLVLYAATTRWRGRRAARRRRETYWASHTRGAAAPDWFLQGKPQEPQAAPGIAIAGVATDEHMVEAIGATQMSLEQIEATLGAHYGERTPKQINDALTQLGTVKFTSTGTFHSVGHGAVGTAPPRVTPGADYKANYAGPIPPIPADMARRADLTRDAYTALLAAVGGVRGEQYVVACNWAQRHARLSYDPMWLALRQARVRLINDQGWAD